MKAAAFIGCGAMSDPREGRAPPLQSIAGTQIMFVGAAACPARMPIPVPCRPSASGPAVPEPIRSTSRQFPGVNASTSGLRRGCGGRLCKKSPTGVFSFLHRRGAFFLFDKAEKKEWGSQKRRASDKYKRTELNGAAPVYGGRQIVAPTYARGAGDS